MVHFLDYTVLTHSSELVMPNGQSISLLPNSSVLFMPLRDSCWRCLQVFPSASHLDVRGMAPETSISNNVSDAVNDIDFLAGTNIDKAFGAPIVLPNITKRLDASWSAGSGNGGLDTGSVANGTYHCFAIGGPTVTPDAIFSTSPTSPTLPTGYVLKRYVGPVIRSGGSNLGFSQLGNEFLLNTEVLDNAAGSPPASTSGILQTLTVPSGVQVFAQVVVGLLYVSAGNYLKVTSPDQTDAAASATNFTVFVLSTATLAWAPLSVRTNTSAQIRYRVDNVALQFRAITRGWIIPL
jgi:hypothetical protein